MRYRPLVILTIFLIISLPTLAQADNVDDFIHTEMQRRHIPGLTFAVIQDGKVVKEKAYGLANVELNVPATTDTLYQIASATKTFTATAIMALVEEGKFSLDEKIIKLLPEVPAAWGEVTVRHCLTHTSGLPDLFSGQCSQEPIADTPEEALKKLASQPVLSQPGDKWRYIQTGYMLLGMIIERVSGRSFEQFLHQRFFRPLRMTATRFGDYQQIIPARASLYTRIELCRGNDLKMSRDTIYSAQPAYLYKPFTYPAGGINTTVGDLVKWNLALSEGRVLKKTTLDEMWAVAKLNDGKEHWLGGTQGYASGWIVDVQPGHKSAGHSGGGSTAYRQFLDDKLTVIVLTNLQGVDPDSLVKGIAAFYLPATEQKVR